MRAHICKYYIILYKGLGHPQMFVSSGGLGINPSWMPRVTNLTENASGKWMMHQHWKRKVSVT